MKILYNNNYTVRFVESYLEWCCYIHIHLCSNVIFAAPRCSKNIVANNQCPGEKNNLGVRAHGLEKGQNKCKEVAKKVERNV